MLSQEKFDRVVALLKSEDHNLKSLARLSGRDTFRFYNSADLTNLDLSGQDLSGLNFDYADIRSSVLDGASFDIGSFNNSIVDSSQLWVKDQFEYGVDEIAAFPINKLLVFCRLRHGIIDILLSVIGINYSRFANRAGISVNSLRKARNSQVISLGTCMSTLLELRSLISNTSMELSAKYAPLIEQPCVSLLVGGNNAPFVTLSKKDLAKLFAIRAARDIAYPGVYHVDGHQMRDTAEFLYNFEFLLKP